jgi:hypothetical protein
MNKSNAMDQNQPGDSEFVKEAAHKFLMRNLLLTEDKNENSHSHLVVGAKELFKYAQATGKGRHK